MQANNYSQLIADLKQKKIPSIETIQTILTLSKEVISKEPNVLKLEAPVVVIGNVNGQLHDFIEILNKAGTPSADNRLLFLGDLVCRGHNSLETLLIALNLKLQYPDYVTILRGKMENTLICDVYGFSKEVEEKLADKEFKAKFYELFDVLPLAATIGKKVIAIHGGISRHVKTIEDIEKIDRMMLCPKEGAMTDLIWSDPNDQKPEVDFEPSPRGASEIFGEKPLKEFLEKNGFEYLVRTHQWVEEGYKYDFGKKVLTVFSAPNYCYQCGNKAGIAKIGKDLKAEVITFEATADNLKEGENLSEEEKKKAQEYLAMINQLKQKKNWEEK